MDNLLWEGINLMIVGMGAVFVFLLLLVFTTSVMSALVARFFPEPSIPKVTPPSAYSDPSSIQSENEKLLAVISAAIHRHRSRHK